MTFKTFKDAFDDLQQYEPVNGIIPDGFESSIRGLIVGVESEAMSQTYYLPNQENLRNNPDLSPKGDLDKIEYWAVLRDGKDTLMSLNEVLKSPRISEYLKTGGRYKRLTVTKDWSASFNIMRGHDVRLWFNNAPSFEFKITDAITGQVTDGTVSTEGNEGRETFFIGYMHTNYDLINMTRASISFRLKDKNSHPVEISVEFQWT